MTMALAPAPASTLLILTMMRYCSIPPALDDSPRLSATALTRVGEVADIIAWLWMERDAGVNRGHGRVLLRGRGKVVSGLGRVCTRENALRVEGEGYNDDSIFWLLAQTIRIALVERYWGSERKQGELKSRSILNRRHIESIVPCCV